MPYLQLDTPFSCTASQKQRLARRFGEIYSSRMQTDMARVTVAIRELGPDSMWRCGPGDPYPAALLMCDIRKGRNVEARAELARLLVEACREIVGLSNENLNLEFTQHDGDEMYHPMLGGFSADWIPEEADPKGG
jgi:phenylpyruvate tautomerase PptA (4-oxalocrotonate tautomerase family)